VEDDEAVAGVEDDAVADRRRKEEVGTNRANKGLQRKPSSGAVRCNSLNRRRKLRAQTMRHQGLQTSAARTRLTGSAGGRRRRISSTTSAGSSILLQIRGEERRCLVRIGAFRVD